MAAGPSRFQSSMFLTGGTSCAQSVKPSKRKCQNKLFKRLFPKDFSKKNQICFLRFQVEDVVTSRWLPEPRNDPMSSKSIKTACIQGERFRYGEHCNIPGQIRLRTGWKLRMTNLHLRKVRFGRPVRGTMRLRRRQRTEISFFRPKFTFREIPRRKFRARPRPSRRQSGKATLSSPLRRSPLATGVGASPRATSVVLDPSAAPLHMHQENSGKTVARSQTMERRRGVREKE